MIDGEAVVGRLKSLKIIVSPVVTKLVRHSFYIHRLIEKSLKFYRIVCDCKRLLNTIGLEISIGRFLHFTH